MQVSCMDRSPIATHAILFFETGGYGSSGGSFATIHPVEAQQNGQTVIKAGTPVTRRAVLEAMRSLVNDKVVPEITPAHVLAKGSGYVAWYRPPERRTVWVRNDKGERSGEVPLPGLIWIATRGSLSVFAYKGTDRPTAETALHQAPFLNVWKDGAVCLGNAALPKGKLATVPEAWEEMFFRSWFTHANTPKISKGKEGATAFFESLLNGDYKAFPQRKLLPIGKTLGAEFAATVMGRKKAR